MRTPYGSTFPKLQEVVRELMASMPECHGWDHTVRVWHNARHLAAVEGADAAVVAYAAMLHDVGRIEEFADAGKTCHAELGAARAPAILADLGLGEPEFVSHVVACIQSHRYRRRDQEPPRTLEARIVFDADKLDSMGAVGVGRAFHFAGRVGARVHNTREEALASESYSLQDTAYREFLVKMQHLQSAMLTPEGRRMAADRHQFMSAFFERLNREAEGEDYGCPS